MLEYVVDFSYYWVVIYECCPSFVFVSFINLILVGLFLLYLKVLVFLDVFVGSCYFVRLVLLKSILCFLFDASRKECILVM